MLTIRYVKAAQDIPTQTYHGRQVPSMLFLRARSAMSGRLALLYGTLCPWDQQLSRRRHFYHRRPAYRPTTSSFTKTPSLVKRGVATPYYLSLYGRLWSRSSDIVLVAKIDASSSLTPAIHHGSCRIHWAGHINTSAMRTSLTSILERKRR